MAQPRKHDYPVGIPLRPPPGWRGPAVEAAPPCRPLPPPRPVNALALKAVLIALMVVVCMGVGWLAANGLRRSAAKRPRGKPGSAVAVTRKLTPREESRPVQPAPLTLPPAEIDKPPVPNPTPMPVKPKPERTGPTPGPVLTYERHILPIMQRSCISCHGRAKKRGGLDLTSFASLKRGGETGTGVVPGKPDDSPIYETIQAGKMPPKGKKLPAGDLRLIRQWIEGGAKGVR